MGTIVGWIGVGLLMFSYMLLNSKKYSKYFLVIDATASLMLTLHAYLIKDLVFFIVNLFISIMLIMKHLKGGIK